MKKKEFWQGITVTYLPKRYGFLLAFHNILNIIRLYIRIMFVLNSSIDCSYLSGKSSVLQSIIGLQILPDGIGTVTRCPIKIRLLRSNNEEFFVWNHHDDASKKENHKVPRTENWSAGVGLIF